MFAQPLSTVIAPVSHRFVLAQITQFSRACVAFTLFLARFDARQILSLLRKCVQEHTKPEVGLNVICWRNLIAFRAFNPASVRYSIDTALTKRVLARQKLWILNGSKHTMHDVSSSVLVAILRRFARYRPSVPLVCESLMSDQ